MVDMFNCCLEGNCGILLVADKTSYAVGVNSGGVKLYMGGWGTRLAEDGSEYHIGLMAVKAVIAEYERLEGRTLLSETVIRQLNIKDIGELKYQLQHRKINDKKICSLSCEVLNCARLGDRISINIINKASERLFDMVDIIVRRLYMYDQSYSLCLSGSIAGFREFILEPLCDKIYKRYDNLTVFTYTKNNQKKIFEKSYP